MYGTFLLNLIHSFLILLSLIPFFVTMSRLIKLISYSYFLTTSRLIKLGLSIDEDEEEEADGGMPELETDDGADSSAMEEVD